MGTFAKLFKSKFFITVLCAALLLSIIPGVLIVMGQANYVSYALQIAASPFQWCFSKVGSGFDGYFLYFRTIRDLREENARLRAELEENNSKVYNAEKIVEENAYLRDYLGLKSEHNDFLFEEATVIGRDPTNYRIVYTLSKGSMHGIEVNMPVVTEDGLVGYVVEAGPTWSRAVAVTETAEAVGAYIERSGALGVVEGTYELRFDGLCLMKYIDPASDIRTGDKVITSGIGSIYPRGLQVGIVSAVQTDPNTRTLTATVRPYADFEGISRVMIITDYNIYSE